VLAEWRFESGGQASLHVHCHVSGEERWLAPPALRNYIFQREMPLVSCSFPLFGEANRCCLVQPCPCKHTIDKFLSTWVCDLLGVLALQVLDTVLYADRVLLSQLPCFQNAAVVVHLTSHIKVSSAGILRNLRVLTSQQ
jgi:hypothetical protein